MGADADACAQRILALFGDALLEPAGVLHVVAVWRGARPGDPLRVLRIAKRTPRSDTDQFALAVARARADAIVTTGKVLRDEPALTHALPGPDEVARGLAAWRARCLRRSAPPLSVVLSARADLDLDHPLFRAGAPVVLYTSVGAARELRSRARARGVELIARERPGLRDAIAHLRETRGAATVTVEAGPSSAAALYADAPAVDELMLSVFEEAKLPDEVLGAPLIESRRLAQLFDRTSPPREVLESSGRWTFQRLWRSASPTVRCGAQRAEGERR
jgi:riboflavin biosynthesis pyrimidine reductase